MPELCRRLFLGQSAALGVGLLLPPTILRPEPKVFRMWPHEPISPYMTNEEIYSWWSEMLAKAQVNFLLRGKHQLPDGRWLYLKHHGHTGTVGACRYNTPA